MKFGKRKQKYTLHFAQRALDFYFSSLLSMSSLCVRIVLSNISFQFLSSPSFSFPSLSFSSLSFPSFSFPSFSFPSLYFPSLSFPSLSFQSLSFPSLSYPSFLFMKCPVYEILHPLFFIYEMSIPIKCPNTHKISP